MIRPISLAVASIGLFCAALGMGMTPLAVFADTTADSEVSAAADSSEPAASELAVAPLTPGSVTYPPQRPEWVEQAPDLTGDLHRWPVVSTPASSPELSRLALQAQLRAAAETYVETLVKDEAAASVVMLDDNWIADRLSADHHYDGEVDVGGETMYESAAQLLFEPADRQWIEKRWQSHQVTDRLVQVAIFTVLGGTFLFVLTTGMSMVARRAENRVTSS